MCGFLGQINLSYKQNDKYEFIKSARLISSDNDNSYYFEKFIFKFFQIKYQRSQLKWKTTNVK